MKSKDIDFARANLLMQTIVEAGKHGPIYQKLAGLAGQELKKMLDEDRQPQVVTPAGGPANSLILDKDGKPVPPALTLSDDTKPDEAFRPKPDSALVPEEPINRRL